MLSNEEEHIPTINLLLLVILDVAWLGQAEGHDKVSGISSVIGTYKLDEEKPYRQHISFEKLRLEPGDKSAEGLDRWLALTKDSNKTMVQLSQSPGKVVLLSHLEQNQSPLL